MSVRQTCTATYMMRVILVLVSFLFSVAADSQIRVRNMDLKNPDSAVLFRDLMNNIEISGIKNMSQYLVYWDGAYIAYTGERKQLVTRISKDTVTVKVNYMGKGKSVLVYTRKFLVQDAGSPTVVLDEKQNDTLSNGQIWNGTSLEVKVPNANYGGNWGVAHFEISMYDSTGREILPPTFVSGKYLGREKYDQVKSLPGGSSIRFTQVVLTYTNGGYQQYKDFVLKRN